MLDDIIWKARLRADSELVITAYRSGRVSCHRHTRMATGARLVVRQRDLPKGTHFDEQIHERIERDEWNNI